MAIAGNAKGWCPLAGNSWREATLGDEIELLTGFPFESKYYTESPDGVRLVRGDNVVQAQIRWDGVKRWPKDQTANLAQYCLSPGDVVLAMDRPWIEAGLKYACLTQDDTPALLVQRVARLRGRANLHTAFLRYVIGSPAFTQHVQSVQTGTAVPHISGAQIKQFKFRLPPLPEQRAIAGVLGALDDKIEVNRTTARVLEGIARAVFTSWFVDFDPVRSNIRRREHAALGRAGRFISTGDDITIRDPSGQVIHRAGDAAQGPIAHLFPDRLVDSAIGEVPEGWRVGTLGDIAAFNARTLSRADPLAGAKYIDYIEISEVMRGDIGQVTRYAIGSEPSRAKRRLTHGDTVLSTVRPDRGAHFLCLNPPETLIASTGFAVMTAKETDWAFLYIAATDPRFATELGRLADGGAYPAVRPEAIAGLPLVLPPTLALRLAFHSFASPLLERAQHGRSQSATLAALRDALLPKLISGELRITDAEKIVGRAV